MLKIFPSMMLALVLFVALPATAQDRLPAIPADKMTEAQKQAAAVFKEDRGGEVSGPFMALLRSPETMVRVEKLGQYLRYKTTLGSRLSEFIILITARHYTQHYEWSAHYQLALQAGLSPEIAKAVAEGRRPTGMAADQEIVYDLISELLNNRSVSDPTYARALEKFGEQGTVEIVSVSAYYTLLSMVLNTARTAVTSPPAVVLKPLP